jgi:CheY-like chemotaxis protein
LRRLGTEKDKPSSATDVRAAKAHRHDDGTVRRGKFDPTMATNHPHNILVVEDNAVNAKILSRLLQKFGYQSTRAVDGLEALRLVKERNASPARRRWRMLRAVSRELARQQRVDVDLDTTTGSSALATNAYAEVRSRRPTSPASVSASSPFTFIFMDMNMPVMGGAMSTRLMRLQLPPAYFPYIAALTANVTHFCRAAIAQAGIDAYLTKPIDVELLRDALVHGVPSGAVLRHRAAPPPT